MQLSLTLSLIIRSGRSTPRHTRELTSEREHEREHELVEVEGGEAARQRTCAARRHAAAARAISEQTGR